MKKIIQLILFSVSSIASVSQVYYVDPLKGNDLNPGSDTLPLQSLEKAVQTASTLTGDSSITIKLFPGFYLLKDKLVLSVKSAMPDLASYTIESVFNPDDTAWTPYKMPVIQSISPNNSQTQFNHSTGILVAVNNVVIRGLKFLGNPKNFTGSPKAEASYYYPISKEDPKIPNLEVTQCMFVAEKNSSPIQGAIWVHGRNTNINYCVFFNCRNAILLFRNIAGLSITNNIISGAYESALWLGTTNEEFPFNNNIIINSSYILLREEGSNPPYLFSNSIISGNKNFLGFYNATGISPTKNLENLQERNVDKKTVVSLVEMDGDKLPKNYLHPAQGGLKVKSGLFK